MTGTVERSRRFRSAIAGFIEERREAKLKGKPDEDGSVSKKYDYEFWLADAARRVGQIQSVTHVLKATHPDARGSSLYVKPSDLPAHAEIGTHLLGDDFAEDVVGNAAALDVYKLLRIEVEGQPLLHWMQAGDPDLSRALHSDPSTAENWMTAFAALVREETKPVSHELAKQIYWLVGNNPADDSDYHLLQPLFSSSLAHEVDRDIRETRFGEESKALRGAFRDRKPYDGVYREYRGLAYRKLGGTKPQNISQLNSERGGVNYLLASLPPTWRLRNHLRLLGRHSAFDVFPYYDNVRKQVQALSNLLKEHEDETSNLAIRQARERLEQDLGASLAAFGLEAQQHHPTGWTRETDCELPLCERMWLDPDRSGLEPRPEHHEEDEAFRVAYTQGEWADEVAVRFANWLNSELRNAGVIALGDAEARHWARQALVDVSWPVPLQRRTGGAA